MKEFWNTIQLIFMAIGGWLGWFLGGCDGLLYALVAFVAVDYTWVSDSPYLHVFDGLEQVHHQMEK